MLPRGCLNLSRAQIAIHCYSSHGGINGTASWSLGRIKKDYTDLGVQVKSIGAEATSFFLFFQLEEQVQPGVTWKSLRVTGTSISWGNSDWRK